MRPPNNSFLPCQIDYILDDSAICVVEKPRQVGFTWISGYKICRRIWSAEVPIDHYWISKDEFTAKLFLHSVLKWIMLYGCIANYKKKFKQDIIDMNGVQAMRIRFDCGANLYVLSSSVDAVVGKEGDFYIDEAAIHKDFEALYNIAYPCTTWGYKMTIFSTHRSKQTYFYKLCQRIKKGEIIGGKLFTLTLMDVLDQGYINKINAKKMLVGGDTYDTPMDFFNEKKQNASSEAMFLQEYMAIPADAEAVQAVTEDDLRKMMKPQGEIFKPPRAGGRYYAGIDIGRNRDLTVFWVVEDVSTATQPLLVTRHVEVMNKEKFSTQERRLALLIQQWRPYKCLIDGTNIGAGVAENLAERFSNVEDIKITRTTRPLWISNLIGFTKRIETCLQVPDTNEVWEDFLSVERYINKEGKEDFFIPSHKERGHGDRFMSLVLCLEAFTRCRSLARYTLETEGTLTTEVKSQKEINKEVLKVRKRRSRISGF